MAWVLCGLFLGGFLLGVVVTLMAAMPYIRQLEASAERRATR